MTTTIPMIAPDTMNLQEGAKAVGIEYAVRRIKDHAFLYCPSDDLSTGHDESAWEPDQCNATWVQHLDDAWDLADKCELTDPDKEEDMLDGYQIVARPWFYEEDLIDNDEEAPLETLDFTALGITPADFEQ